MSQIRDIKSRIESVKKTKKITQAMKMVAASKFKRATNRRDSNHTYLNHLNHMVQKINAYVTESEYAQVNQSNTVACIILSSDRGLCGGFNSSILKHTHAFLKTLDQTPELYLIGKKAQQFFANKSWAIQSDRSTFGGAFSLNDITHYIQPIIDRYLDGTYQNVYIIYNSFISAIQNEPKSQQLLPITFDNHSNQPPIDIILEPNNENVLGEVIRECLIFSFIEALIDSHASEEGARMAAMDSATDNAAEMIKDLTLLYNRTRQAQITTELSEIVAGAEALVS